MTNQNTLGDLLKSISEKPFVFNRYRHNMQFVLPYWIKTDGGLRESCARANFNIIHRAMRDDFHWLDMVH